MDKNFSRINIIRLVVVLAAAGMIVYGAVSGQGYTVFQKAIMVCLECIGLG